MGKIIQGTQSVHRAICIMKMIAMQNQQKGVRLVDIAHELKLEMPTAHRLLQSLVEESILVKSARNSRYHLGPLVFELGLASAHDFNVINLCTPILKELSHQTTDTSFLFVRSGNDAVCLAREQGTYHIQTPVVPVGSRQPLGVSAGGLALLSALDPNDMEIVLQANSTRLDVYGGLTIEKAKELYEEAKQLGYAVIANMAVPGVKGIGIPINDRDAQSVAAVTVATTIGRMTNEHIQEILPDLQSAAAKIGSVLRQKEHLL